MNKSKTLLIRIITVVFFVALAVLMYFLGRGHTVYIDNKKLEYNGTTYMAFFPVVEEDSEDEENEEEYGLVILKSQMENGEEFLVTIDDEEEIDKVYDLFMEQILSDEE